MSKEITKIAPPVEAPLALPATEFDGMVPQVPRDAELPEVKISRETAQFELPNGEFVREITGHLLFWHEANTFWKDPFGKGDGFPTCMSCDGRKPQPADFDGYKVQSPTCDSCPQNQFGSALTDKGEEGRGKACQNTIRLYLLLDGDLIPTAVKVTPMGLGRKSPLQKWLFSVLNDVGQVLGAKRARYQYARVGLTLDPDNSGTFKTAVIHPKTLSVVTDPAEVERLSMSFRSFKGLWSNEQVTSRMVTESKGEQVGKPITESEFVEREPGTGGTPF
jgi:hypothetical protein